MIQTQPMVVGLAVGAQLMGTLIAVTAAGMIVLHISSEA